eukprot:scaffold398979_cov40-Prasinocladus_malaysianus.AAC.1
MVEGPADPFSKGYSAAVQDPYDELSASVDLLSTFEQAAFGRQQDTAKLTVRDASVRCVDYAKVNYSVAVINCASILSSGPILDV